MSSQVDLVETEPSSNVYQDPSITMQARFNANSVGNDYCNAFPVNGTRGHTDSDGSNYTSINPLYGLNTDSGDEYSVIENKHVRIKEYKGSFGSESRSSAPSLSGTPNTNVPVYAVVNKKKKDVPLYAQVIKKGKKGHENVSYTEEQVSGGVKGNRKMDDTASSYSFENKLSGQYGMPNQGKGGFVKEPISDDTYQMVDNETPGMTYTLEGEQSKYTLEEAGEHGPNEYLDVLPDSVDAQSQGTGDSTVKFKGKAAQQQGNGHLNKANDLAARYPVGHSKPQQYNGNLGSKAGWPGIPQADPNLDEKRGKDEEYVYTYSHFPKNKGQNGQGLATNGDSGSPVTNGEGKKGCCPPQPGKGRQTTESVYALEGVDHEGKSRENVTMSNQGNVESEPVYFLYGAQGGDDQDDDGEEYQYIPRENATGAEQLEDDIYHEPDTDQNDPVYAEYLS
jgi:hypothetical protein